MYETGVWAVEGPVDGDWSEPASALPDFLQVTAPGAQLGALLEPIDRSRLDDADLVVLAQCRARQIARLQAQQMADLVEIAARCAPIEFPPPGLRGQPIDYAQIEIATAMTWTMRSAEDQLDLARRVVHGLPAVHEAMLSGQIDYLKAKTFADAVVGLDRATARKVVDQVLPCAASRTSGQIRGRLARQVLKADPAAAARRYRRGVRNRCFH
jgi:hypothetical protein